MGNTDVKYVIEGGGRFGRVHGETFLRILGKPPIAVSTSSESSRAYWQTNNVRVMARGRVADAIAEDLDFAVVSVLPDVSAEALLRILTSDSIIAMGDVVRARALAILAEKPIATSHAETEAIIHTAEDKNVQLFMTGQTRFSPMWKRFIRDGTSDLDSLQKISIRRKFRSGADKYGSAIWNLMPHCATELQYVLRQHNLTLDDVSILEAKEVGENVVIVEARIPNGTLISIEVGQGVPEDKSANDTTLLMRDGTKRVFEEKGKQKTVTRYLADGRACGISGRVNVENTVEMQDVDFLNAIGVLKQPDAVHNEHMFDPKTEHRRILDISNFLQKVDEISHAVIG